MSQMPSLETLYTIGSLIQKWNGFTEGNRFATIFDNNNAVNGVYGHTFFLNFPPGDQVGSDGHQYIKLVGPRLAMATVHTSLEVGEKPTLTLFLSAPTEAAKGLLWGKSLDLPVAAGSFGMNFVWAQTQFTVPAGAYAYRHTLDGYAFGLALQHFTNGVNHTNLVPFLGENSIFSPLGDLLPGEDPIYKIGDLPWSWTNLPKNDLSPAELAVLEIFFPDSLRAVSTEAQISYLKSTDFTKEKNSAFFKIRNRLVANGWLDTFDNHGKTFVCPSAKLFNTLTLPA